MFMVYFPVKLTGVLQWYNHPNVLTQEPIQVLMVLNIIFVEYYEIP